VIHGPRGVDVSAAVSAAAAALPDWASASGAPPVLRFIGTSTDSTDVHALVASVRAQILQASYGCAASSGPRDSCLHYELTALRAELEKISRSVTGPLVLLLDGVDSLQPQRTTLQALWAVCNLPANICLVLSVSHSSIEADALLALLTDPDLTYNLSSDPSLGHPSVDTVTQLGSTLDTLEAEIGPVVTKYFAAYVAVVEVGILDSELYDLLSTSDEVVAERGHAEFTPGLVSILRHRLTQFLAPRLVGGCAASAWSRPEYRQAAAARYHVTLGGVASDEFTRTLHRGVVGMYRDVTGDGSDQGTRTSFVEGDARTTRRRLGPGNAVEASRLLYHLRALLPVDEGSLDQLKSRIHSRVPAWYREI